MELQDNNFTVFRVKGKYFILDTNFSNLTLKNPLVRCTGKDPHSFLKIQRNKMQNISMEGSSMFQTEGMTTVRIGPNKMKKNFRSII